MKSRILSITAFLAMPFLAMAAAPDLTGVFLYENSFVTVVNQIIVPILVSIAFISFIWGVYKYFIAGSASPEKRKEGASFIMYSVIGFAIIFSIWGLVNLFAGFFGLTGYRAPAYPTL
ncbi:hypothetical protein MNBD_CPR01-165 [hydrothermal vent metagenome]|uniref:Uncharacterized protein n=1 Tax=hydrothermal vent metagenome TaxID=652676 RepID=A0A3B0UPI2_9ZZZZ